MLEAARIVDDLKVGKVFPVYVISGDDIYHQDMLLKNFCSILLPVEFNHGLNIHILETVPSTYDLLAMANSLPFFASWRIIIVKDQNYYKQSLISDDELKELFSYLDNPNSSTCLIFLVRGNMDKRSKLFKKFKETSTIIELTTPRGSNLVNWIKKEFNKYGKEPEAALISLLASAANGDLYFLSGEINKICTYVGNNRVIKLEETRSVFAKTLNLGVFQVIDALAEGNMQRALKGLENLLDAGESEILINHLIARHFRLILKALVLKDKGVSSRAIIEKLNVASFIGEKILKQSKLFNMEEVLDILTKLGDLDIKLKTSSANSKRSLELTLLQMKDVECLQY
ncbi:MAG: DNA polymerase III subunit delta [Bacillota bacterium]